MILIVFAVMFRSWFQVSLTTYLPSWIQAGGGSVAAGGRLLSVLLFSVGLGSLVGGAMGDRFGAWQVVAFSLLSLSFTYWLLLNASSAFQPLILVLIGALLGSTYPVTIVMAHDAWPGRIGVASGLVMGLGWWPGGLGASFTGWIADRSTLDAGMQTLFIAPLLGAACVLLYALLLRAKQPLLRPAAQE
jgi:FSR family fosmidomycin resistance protein-like MFS transporter